MPSESELPPGTRRDFVELLFRIFKAADRPPLHKISDAIAKLEDRRGTASIETIRRMLHGTTVPANWDTVEAVALGLCQLANWDLRDQQYIDDYDASLREHLRGRWHRALDEPDFYYPRRMANQDPWDSEAPF